MNDRCALPASAIRQALIACFNTGVRRPARQRPEYFRTVQQRVFELLE
jgi:hypothetical protein